MKVLAMSKYSDFEKVFSQHVRKSGKIRENLMPPIDLSPLYSRAKKSGNFVSAESINAQSSKLTATNVFLPVFKQFIKLFEG